MHPALSYSMRPSEKRTLLGERRMRPSTETVHDAITYELITMRRPSTWLAAVLGLALAILWSAPSAPAQPSSSIPHIGYIWFGPEGSDKATMLPGFRQGLRELGYKEPKRCQQPRQFTGKIALGGRGANRADLI